jgi:hypothetical protein
MHNPRKFAYASFLTDAISLFFSVNLRKPGTFSTRQIIWTVGYKFLLGPKTQNLGLRIIGTRLHVDMRYVAEPCHSITVVPALA